MAIIAFTHTASIICILETKKQPDHQFANIWLLPSVAEKRKALAAETWVQNQAYYVYDFGQII